MAQGLFLPLETTKTTSFAEIFKIQGSLAPWPPSDDYAKGSTWTQQG